MRWKVGLVGVAAAVGAGCSEEEAAVEREDAERDDVAPRADAGLDAAPDAGPACAPAQTAWFCVSEVGAELPWELDERLEGTVASLEAAGEDCAFDLAVGGRGGSTAAFQLQTEAGRVLSVHVSAELEAYLAAHPLAIGEPVRLHLRREEFGIAGAAMSALWTRGDRIVAGATSESTLDGVRVGRGREVATREDDCCVVHEYVADIRAGDAAVSVPPGCRAETEGLTISNVSFASYEDLGCCNALGGPSVTVVARP